MSSTYFLNPHSQEQIRTLQNLKGVEEALTTRMNQEPVYMDLIEAGYSWATNIRADSSDEYRRKYEQQGFEVVIHNVAFDRCGNLLSEDSKAVLVRKNLLPVFLV
ncbi:hypothetical protein HY486_02420 [Candidatus Woesearchaeota archaeon]|nr:hypothetical protein [Candidatus Woesearchaeota archaeon]